MLDPDATVIRPIRPAPADDPDATIVRGGPAPLPSHLRRLPVALPPGFRLHEYRIDGVLGQGGFGITYLATDVNLNARVAIKEYLPEDIAFRSGDVSVGPNGSQHRDRYRLGLENFLQEARTLASFRHPAIVRVARFFEAHRTAYMVLEYEQGAPLKTWWPEHLAIGEAGLVELLLPLFDGLAVVHAAGVLHRDIKPDNIQVRSADGRLVLLDFGSAGQAVAEAAGGPGAVVVTPGYAPPEQYGSGPQGPWTDVYALAATLYWCVTGRKPPDAEHRVARPESFVTAVEACRGRFGRPFLQAIDQALSLDPAARPPDIAEFRRQLFADHLSSMGLQEALQSRDSDLPAGEDGSPAAHARPRRRWARLLSPAGWPLALKMTLAMLATALLPMLLTAAWNLHGSQAAVADAELRFVRHLAASTAGRLAQFVADSRHLAKALGSDLDFVQFLSRPDDGERAPMREKLVRQVAANPDVQLIMLMDRHGSALISSDPQVEGRNFAFRQYFKEAMAGRPAMTGLTVGAVAGASGMFYAEPVKGEGGEVLGAVVLRMRGSSVAAILDAVGRDQALTPFLIDGDGVLIHHPRPEFLYRSLMPLAPDRLAAIKADQRFRRDTIQSLDQPVLAAAMVGAQAVGDVSYNSHLTNRPEIAGFAPVAGHDWVVGVSESRDRFEEPLARLFRNLLWSVLAAGLLFAWLALRFARGIVRPIQDLTRAANALKAGDFGNATVSVQRRDEVGQLARTFNVMIDVLRQRERERDR